MNFGLVLGHLGDQEILRPEVGIKDNELIVSRGLAEANKN